MTKKITQEVTEEMFLADLEASFADFLTDKEGVKSVDRRIYKIKKAPVYSVQDIKRIRNKYNYSQKTLASILNVSVRTVENWEISKSQPSGSTFRLLELLEKMNFTEEIEERIIVNMK